ncbi:hypothetical protein CYMTET_55841 [Cymbomonas tetramitiformis]|uniref:PKD/REJ-like domain-containing protein n=1 Tax=Cymbomonas tetramitiformis TaxID=36881 RepID=A0AAE0BCG5_9CHLO|nr:hypothetical protein CYMTET_55841 [Cymbomonas tetramitiformis]
MQVESDNPDTLVRAWTVIAEDGTPHVDLNTAALTPLNLAEIVVRQEALVIGGRYTFQLQVSDALGEAFTTLGVLVNTPPASGTVNINPVEGTALETYFDIDAPGWLDPDTPLWYQLNYAVVGSGAIDMLTDYQPQTKDRVLVPDNGHPDHLFTVEIYAYVRDALGAVSSASTNITVRPVEVANSAEVTDFVASGIAEGETALSNGDVTKTLALLNGMTSVMDQDSLARRRVLLEDQEGANVTAERQAARLDMLAMVTKSKDAVAVSTETVERLAKVGLRVVAVPEEVCAEGRDSGFSLLSSLVHDGASQASITGGATVAMTDGLSSLVTSSAVEDSASANGTSATTVTARRGLSVMQDLSGALVAAMAVGEEAVESSSDVFTMRVQQEDLSDPGSAAFAAPLRSPDGISQVAFPASIGEALGVTSGTGTAISLLTSTVDPHLAPEANGSLAAAVTSITLSRDGVELGVEGLEEAVTFDLPIEPPDAYHLGSNATEAEPPACAFFDLPTNSTGGGAYRTEGCMAMPMPVPASVELHWWTLNVSEAGGYLDRMWAIQRTSSGWFLQNCTETYEAHDSRYAGADAGYRKFVGEGCMASSAMNPSGCWWQWEQQAFAGSGCVWSSHVRCLCTHLTDFKPVRQRHAPPSMPQGGLVSTEDMTSLSGDDIAKSVLLLGILGALMLGSVLMARLSDVAAEKDRKQRYRVLLESHGTDSLWFQKVDEVWTWCLAAEVRYDTVGMRQIAVNAPGEAHPQGELWLSGEKKGFVELVDDGLVEHSTERRLDWRLRPELLKESLTTEAAGYFDWADLAATNGLFEEEEGGICGDGDARAAGRHTWKLGAALGDLNIGLGAKGEGPKHGPGAESLETAAMLMKAAAGPKWLKWAMKPPTVPQAPLPDMERSFPEMMSAELKTDLQSHRMLEAPAGEVEEAARWGWKIDVAALQDEGCADVAALQDEGCADVAALQDEGCADVAALQDEGCGVIGTRGAREAAEPQQPSPQTLGKVDNVAGEAGPAVGFRDVQSMSEAELPEEWEWRVAPRVLMRGLGAKEASSFHWGDVVEELASTEGGTEACREYSWSMEEPGHHDDGMGKRVSTLLGLGTGVGGAWGVGAALQDEGCADVAALQDEGCGVIGTRGAREAAEPQQPSPQTLGKVDNVAGEAGPAVGFRDVQSMSEAELPVEWEWRVAPRVLMRGLGAKEASSFHWGDVVEELASTEGGTEACREYSWSMEEPGHHDDGRGKRVSTLLGLGTGVGGAWGVGAGLVESIDGGGKARPPASGAPGSVLSVAGPVTEGVLQRYLSAPRKQMHSADISAGYYGLLLPNTASETSESSAASGGPPTNSSIRLPSLHGPLPVRHPSGGGGGGRDDDARRVGASEHSFEAVLRQDASPATQSDGALPGAPWQCNPVPRALCGPPEGVSAEGGGPLTQPILYRFARRGAIAGQRLIHGHSRSQDELVRKARGQPMQSLGGKDNASASTSDHRTPRMAMRRLPPLIPRLGRDLAAAHPSGGTQEMARETLAQQDDIVGLEPSRRGRRGSVKVLFQPPPPRTGPWHRPVLKPAMSKVFSKVLDDDLGTSEKLCAAVGLRMGQLLGCIPFAELKRQASCNNRFDRSGALGPKAPGELWLLASREKSLLHFERMMGTSLVHAFMSLHPFIEDGEKDKHLQPATAMHWEIPAGKDFEWFVRFFQEMLEMELSRGSGWVLRAPLYQLACLQHPNGSFSLTQALANLMQAGEPREPMRSASLLTFSIAAVEHSIPSYLLSLQETQISTDVRRVWATLLAVAKYSRQCYIWTLNPEAHPRERLTLDMKAGQWLEHEAYKSLALLALLSRLRLEASMAVELWEADHVERLRDLQSRHSIGEVEGTSDVGSSWTSLCVLLRNILSSHPFAQIYLTPIRDPFSRTERMYVQMNSFVIMLGVCVIFYYFRAVGCCVELKTYVDCPSPTRDSSCLGYSSCQVLMKAEGTQRLPTELLTSEFWPCTAFPQSTLLGNIFAAVVMNLVLIPVNLVLITLFSLSGAVAKRPGHLKMDIKQAGDKLIGAAMTAALANAVLVVYAMYFEVNASARGLAMLILAVFVIITRPVHNIARAISACKKAAASVIRPISYCLRYLKAYITQLYQYLLRTDPDRMWKDPIVKYEVQFRGSIGGIVDALAYSYLCIFWALTVWVLLTFAMLIREMLGADEEKRVLVAWVTTILLEQFGLQGLRIAVARYAFNVLLGEFQKWLIGSRYALFIWHERYIQQALGIEFKSETADEGLANIVL